MSAHRGNSLGSIPTPPQWQSMSCSGALVPAPVLGRDVGNFPILLVPGFPCPVKWRLLIPTSWGHCKGQRHTWKFPGTGTDMHRAWTRPSPAGCEIEGFKGTGSPTRSAVPGREGAPVPGQPTAIWHSLSSSFTPPFLHTRQACLPVKATQIRQSRSSHSCQHCRGRAELGWAGAGGPSQ